MQPWSNFFRRGILFSGLAAAFLLAACGETKPPYQPTTPSFSATPVWSIAAGRIDIVEAPTVKAPDPGIAIRLAATPVDIARAWPPRRLRVNLGNTGRVVYTIERAEATERYLRTRGGVTGFFARDPEVEFTVAFAVSLNAYNAAGASLGVANADALASGTLAEGEDEDKRRQLWARLLNDATQRLDQELQKQAPVGLARVIQRN
jgi:hypothetical protein